MYCQWCGTLDAKNKEGDKYACDDCYLPDEDNPEVTCPKPREHVPDAKQRQQRIDFLKDIMNDRRS